MDSGAASAIFAPNRSVASTTSPSHNASRKPDADDISTATPILDANGRAIGALNIAVARARWDEAKDEQRYADVLREAAATVSAPQLPHRARFG